MHDHYSHETHVIHNFDIVTTKHSMLLVLTLRQYKTALLNGHAAYCLAIKLAAITKALFHSITQVTV